jgi:hypothetical protein
MLSPPFDPCLASPRAARHRWSGWENPTFQGSAAARWLAALAFILVVLWAGSARAAFDFNDNEWEGTSALLEIARAELGKERVALVATLDFEELTPNDGVLVLHPEVELNPDEVAAFLIAGGRLAVLDDHGKATSLLARYRIQRVGAPLRPGQTLRQNPDLAVAVPAVQAVAGVEQNRHPVVVGVERLVTNHPSALVHPNLTPVLEIPAVGEPNATLAVTGVIANRGRLFVMGDPSALINLMMRYPGNRAFGTGLVKYLVEPDTWGERGGKLYLVANDFRQRGQYGGQGGLVRDAREALSAFEEVLAEVRKNGLPSGVALAFGAAAGLLLLAWALGSALKTYRPYLPRYAAAQPLLAQGGVAGRAAVLSAPSTDHALTLAELHAALIETLAQRVSLDPKHAPDRLVAEAEAQHVLDPASAAEARALLRELARGPAALAVGQRLSIPAARLVELGQKSMALARRIGNV